MSRQYLFLRQLSIFWISKLLLTRFWPNFKCRFLWLSWTDSNCHSDICPGNICQGDICPYQEYLSCYWPDFYQTLRVGSWDHVEQILPPKKIPTKKIFPQKKNFAMNKFLPKKIFSKKKFFCQKKICKKKFSPKINFW